MTSEALSARTVAARVLLRVWDDAAFATAALDAELRAGGVESREAGLATELVLGVLRTEGYLDERLAALSTKKKQGPRGTARAHLLMGAYSLCFLDRIPPFAAVSEAVAGVSACSDASVARFANAVLRKLAEAVEAEGRPSMEHAVLEAAPGWLRGALRRALGRSEAKRMLAAGPIPPPIGLCLALGEDREGWLATLREAAPNAVIEPGEVSPRAILVRGAGDVRRLPGFEERWIIQEEGAQVVALSLGVKAGDRVLDACAGRGNKAFLLAQAAGEGGSVDAADRYPEKLAHLAGAERKDLTRDRYVVDWTSGTGDVPEGYDRILVDAPCSGVGTLRRRPEIARKRTAEDVTRLAELQTAIALSAATRLREGGRLVFAVCSVLYEEAEGVLAAIEAAPKDGPMALAPAPFDDDVASGLAKGATSLRLLPHVHGTDGYFLASFSAARR